MCFDRAACTICTEMSVPTTLRARVASVWHKPGPTASSNRSVAEPVGQDVTDERLDPREHHGRLPMRISAGERQEGSGRQIELAIRRAPWDRGA